MKNKGYFYSLLISIFLVSTGITLSATAQKAKETTATLNDTEYPVFEIIYTRPEDIVEDALLQKLETDGISVKEKRQIIIGKGVNYSDLSDNKLDIYFQIEKKDKNTTLLKLFISKGYDNFIGAQYDSLIAKNALVYLDHFKSDVNYYALQQKIDLNQKNLVKEQDKKRKLAEEKKELITQLNQETEALKTVTGKEAKKAQRKLKRANKQLAKTRKDITQNQGEINKLKANLKQLKTKQSDIHLW